ncbi:hypothetical protein K458DRAFT_81127 [Lentithecium fluviatile CBS 122367]|uniref:Uncharacterized protein n=1 Tax=Lentithecium fluviatile CBS 122367 TaxID=1168545 RepID=A0A6G1IU43_9PLEO|nr:hypothetical protein K458DRAFT_81127 [Lentithecium fluviatile CBS 122367]
MFVSFEYPVQLSYNTLLSSRPPQHPQLSRLQYQSTDHCPIQTARHLRNQRGCMPQLPRPQHRNLRSQTYTLANVGLSSRPRCLQ